MSTTINQTSNEKHINSADINNRCVSSSRSSRRRRRRIINISNIRILIHLSSFSSSDPTADDGDGAIYTAQAEVEAETEAESEVQATPQ